MIHALLLLALAQGDTVTHNNPQRPIYNKAVECCAEAEPLLETSPEAVVEKLAPVFEYITQGRITMFEQQIRIYNKAQEETKHEFYPYSLRGRARLLAAQKRKDNDEARRFLIEAVGDLRTSVARNPNRSKEALASAQQGLWDNVRAALTYEGWKSGGTLLPEAMALIADMDLAAKASEWLGAEIGRVEAQMRELRKTPDLEARRAPAKRAAEWCDTLESAVKGPFPAARAAIAQTRVLAVSIRDSRGTFRLKIIVSPWATVDHLKRHDEEIELRDRDTPLVIPLELEIDSYTVELVHPTKGRKKVSIDANSLVHGRTYVVCGSMAGDVEVAELLK